MSQKRQLFPDTDIEIISGTLAESGTSVVPGAEKKGPQRWVRVGDRTFIRIDDGLYHSRYGDEMIVAYDGRGEAVGYWNKTSGSGSTPSLYPVIGAFGFMIVITGVFYLGGIWNYIWKSDLFKDRWWLTVIAIFIWAMYAVVWTPMFAWYSWKREKKAHALIRSVRGDLQ